MKSLFNLSLLLASFALDAVTASSHQELDGAETVLANIAQYDKLYVSYKGCTWSAYVDGDGDDSCGVEAEGDDDAYWYMGLTECLRANAAYSLYGVLKGEEDRGCKKATFINSFFTTTGVDSFIESLAAAGVAFSGDNDDENQQLSSECNAAEDDDGNNEQAAATSTGLGCSADSQFVYKKYEGAYCDERRATSTIDTLSDLNSELSGIQCVAIYDVTGSAEADAEEEEEQEDGGEDDEGDAVNLLQYSEACSVRLFPQKCPDPHGLLHKDARATSREVASSAHPTRETVKLVFSWLLLGFGILFLLAAAFAYYRKRQATSSSSDNSKKNKSAKKNNKSKKDNGKPGFWGRFRAKWFGSKSN